MPNGWPKGQTTRGIITNIRDDKREKFDKNKFKLNKKEINAIAERKKESSPGSDRSASSVADSKRSEAPSSDSLVSDGDLYSFDQLSIKSRDD